MTDILIVATLVLAFALAVTVHVAIALGLLKRTPRWRAPVAFVVPVFAPYWAWREHMRRRAVLWGLAVAIYLIALIAAR